MKLLAAIVLLSLPSSPQDRAVAELRRAFSRRDATDGSKIVAIRQAAKVHHRKVVLELSRYLTSGSRAVRIVAAEELGRFREVSEAPAALAAAIRSKANASPAMRGVRVMALRGLGHLKARAAAAEVERRIRRERDPWVAKAAVDAAANLRLKSSIEPLLEILRRVEGRLGNDLASIDPLSHPEFPPTSVIDLIIKAPADAKKGERRTGRDLLRKPILDALQRITRQSFSSSKEWRTWWRKSKSTFSVPD